MVQIMKYLEQLISFFYEYISVVLWRRFIIVRMQVWFMVSILLYGRRSIYMVVLPS